MKFLLLVAVCSLAVFASAEDKKKRDILPGDPRYGTDYHHKHHDAHENELEVSRSLGGYVGSYVVPEVNTDYGPPHHKPGKPIGIEQLPTVVENKVEITSPSYGVPEVQEVKEVDKSYLPPVVVESKKVQHFHIPKTTVHKETVHTEFVSPSIATPTISHASPVTIATKTVDKISNPVTSYGVPSLKTTILPTPNEVKVDTTIVHASPEKTFVPEVKVQDHVHDVKTEVKTLTTPQLVQDVPAIDVRLLESNAGVVPTADLSSFSTAGSVSFNQAPTFGSHEFSQPHLVGYDTYGLPDSYNQFGTHYPNFYTNQFGSSGSYDVSLPQSHQVPQTFYSHQTYAPVSTHYSHPVPYALSKTALYQNNFGGAVNQKTGPFTDFLQENFPNFQLPQLPQLPQFPNLGSLFQLPTQTPPTVPIDSTDAEVQRHTEQKVLEVSNKNLVKSVPVSVEDSAKKDTVFTKTTKEYTQPLDSNGGYVY